MSISAAATKVLAEIQSLTPDEYRKQVEQNAAGSWLYSALTKAGLRVMLPKKGAAPWPSKRFPESKS